MANITDSDIGKNMSWSYYGHERKLVFYCTDCENLWFENRPPAS